MYRTFLVVLIAAAFTACGPAVPPDQATVQPDIDARKALSSVDSQAVKDTASSRRIIAVLNEDSSLVWVRQMREGSGVDFREVCSSWERMSDLEDVLVESSDLAFEIANTNRAQLASLRTNVARKLSGSLRLVYQQSRESRIAQGRCFASGNGLLEFADGTSVANALVTSLRASGIPNDSVAVLTKNFRSTLRDDLKIHIAELQARAIAEKGRDTDAEGVFQEAVSRAVCEWNFTPEEIGVKGITPNCRGGG